MTSSGMIALVVLITTIILFLTNKMPMCAVAILGGAAMAAVGILRPLQVFEGASSSPMLYMIGMGIVSQALINAGYIGYIRKLFLRYNRLSEKQMILLFMLIFSIMSVVFQGIVIMLMCMPVICALEKETDRRISRKHLYMPLSFAALLGGNFSIIGSSSMLNAVSQAEAFTGRRVGLFAPTAMGGSSVVVLLIIYATFGYNLQKRVFTYKEPPIPYQIETDQNSICSQGWRRSFVLMVFIGCIIGFVSGVDTGYVSMVAAAILLATGCIDAGTGFRSVDWQVFFTVVGCTAIGKGIELSGAGGFVAERIIRAAGSQGQNAWLMCVIMLFLSTLLSNFMSNNAAVTICVPIAMSIAQQLGADPIVFAVACGVGVNLSVSTPISTTTVSVSASAGYRFSDYLRVGGVVNILAGAGAAIALKVFYL